MTIIHTYKNSSNFKFYSSSLKRNYKNIFSFSKTLLFDGIAKTTLLITIFSLSIIGLWLFVFCSKLSLDYKISVLKKDIQKEEETINTLHESLAQNISDEKIVAWAKNNGFVPITSIKYLKIETPSIAQADLKNIK